VTASRAKGKVEAVLAAAAAIPPDVIAAGVAAYLKAHPPVVTIDCEALAAAVAEHVTVTRSLSIAVPRNAWSVKEFAAAWGVNVNTVYRLINTGQLAWTWIGGEKRIPNAELDRLMAEAMDRRSA